jgi:hypothetical protein
MCRIFEELADKRAEEKRIDTLTISIKNLMANLKWSFDQAIQALDVSEEDRNTIVKRF